MTELEQKLRDIADEKDLKILPENIKKDVQIFDVIGTYEGSGGGTVEGIKQFATEEEMQADETAKEGDLAVVYREEIQNMTADTQTQFITFPETVVLPEAFTSDAYCMLRAVDETVMFDGQVMLNQSMFDFNGYINTGMIRVIYTSSDGITYNRDEFMSDSGDLTNPVDLSTIVGIYSPQNWNDNLGYFMQVGGNVFGGLFEHKLIEDTSKINFISNVELNDAITYDIVTDDYLTITEGLRIVEAITEHFGEIGHMIIIKQNNIITAYIHAIATGALTMDDIMLYNNKIYVGLYTTAIGNMTGSYKIIFSEDLSTYTVEDLTATQLSGNYYSYEEIPVNSKITGLESSGKYSRSINFYDVSNATSTSISFGFGKKGIYEIAPTQLTATSNDVYEKEFYGKNGVEDGTLGTNPSNLFDDSVASIIYSTNEIYATMTPLKITDANKDTISDNIRFIPVNSQGEALLDVSELTDVQRLFADKIYLKDIPCEFGNVYYMSSMCNGCSSLITFPYINTTNSQHANYLCYNCTNLKNVPVMDFANTNTWSNAFSGCPNLSDESLNNILAICISATKSATKTLKYIGLTSAQATKCTTLSNYSAFTAAGWTTGY